MVHIFWFPDSASGGLGGPVGAGPALGICGRSPSRLLGVGGVRVRCVVNARASVVSPEEAPAEIGVHLSPTR